MASNKITLAETEILSSFLLSRAGLKDIISLSQFTLLFPRERRSNPQIKLLYRELQRLRESQIARVRRKIEHEAITGFNQRKVAARHKKLDERVDDENMIGIELFGAPQAQPVLPLKDLLKQMEFAAEELETEQANVEEECQEILEEIRDIVEDLSDLRYGKLASSDTQAQVTREINHLVGVCERILSEPADGKGGS
ncbi:Cnl2/NKP2 family protein-domain-containing protein [Sphaerosporella brunnea]|uniref:Cnl2/NKP2 family protein-domain-containing protein n=1 Tax=Sphaerosporella brunnea TaxID=1250544 RepID=A0A5J5ES89_9PEZI|nr:Cnl2/NKP2 family protein-domain-containing protein [Sphaerosporella brunnea]